jgi:cytohesin
MGALHDAVFKNTAEAIREAIAGGAAIEERDSLDRTALALAAACGYEKTAAALIDAGADLEAQESRRGERPMHVAASEGHADMVRFLVKRGAAIDGRDGRGGTPLLLATISAKADVIRRLVELGADVNPRDVNGDTPLHYLARWAKDWTSSVTMYRIENGKQIPIENPQYGYHLANVKLLIELGADPNAKNDPGQTPLDLAVQIGDEAIAALLASPKKPAKKKSAAKKPAAKKKPAPKTKKKPAPKTKKKPAPKTKKKR